MQRHRGKENVKLKFQLSTEALAISTGLPVTVKLLNRLNSSRMEPSLTSCDPMSAKVTLTSRKQR